MRSARSDTRCIDRLVSPHHSKRPYQFIDWQNCWSVLRLKHIIDKAKTAVFRIIRRRFGAPDELDRGPAFHNALGYCSFRHIEKQRTEKAETRTPVCQLPRWRLRPRGQEGAPADFYGIDRVGSLPFNAQSTRLQPARRPRASRDRPRRHRGRRRPRDAVAP